jgi:hypothetical protein
MTVIGTKVSFITFEWQLKGHSKNLLIKIEFIHWCSICPFFP